MHGLVFVEFKKYFIRRWGAREWAPLLACAGLEDRVFLLDQVYPDAELQALLDATVKTTKEDDMHGLQESFGRAIAPRLLHLYRRQINPSWGPLGLIENVETTIHRVVRMRDPNAEPPRLTAIRTSAHEVAIHYDSPRRLCGVAVGIARGVCDDYEDDVEIHEKQCMLEGADKSVIYARRLVAPVGALRRGGAESHADTGGPG